MNDDADEEALPARNRMAGLSGWLLSLAAHALIAMVLTTMVIFQELEQERAPIQPVYLELEKQLQQEDLVEQEFEQVPVPIQVEALEEAEVEEIDFSTDDDLGVKEEVGDFDVMAGDQGTGGGLDDLTSDGGFMTAAIGAGSGPVAFLGANDQARQGGGSSGVVFIIDMSASMKDDQIAVLKHELSQSLRDLTPMQQFNVIFFSGPAWLVGDDDRALRGEWANEGWHNFWRLDKTLPSAQWERGTARTKQRFLQYLDGLQRSGGTDWRNPFRMAYAMQPQPRSIFFLTDGAVDNPQETMEMVRKYPGIPVHTIAYGVNKKGVDALAEMSRMTRGSHVGYDLEEISRMADRIEAGMQPR